MPSDAILAELRGLPGAPETLRERVLALPEPQPRFSWTLPRLDVRRFLLVAAPAVLALGVGAAALRGVRASGWGSSLSAVETTRHGVIMQRRHPPPGVSRALGENASAERASKATSMDAPPPATTRLNKYEAWL